MKLKRPFLIVVIGFLIGTIMGLYLKINIVLFYIPITIIYIFSKKFKSKKEFKLFSFHRYFRYIKLIISKQVVFCIMISSIISNTIILIENEKYDIEKYDGQECLFIGVIESDKIEKEYQNLYKLKVEEPKEFAGRYFYIRVKKEIEIQYGDKISVRGEIKEAEKRRNYGGFDYKQYLKTIKITGIVKAEKIEVIEKDNVNFILKISNKISNAIKINIEKVFKEEQVGILEALIVGDSSKIEEDIEENFRISNISHVLAVSGMHVGYVVLAITFVSEKIFGKRKSKFITIIFLILYMLITGFSPSVVRSSLMMIAYIFSSIFYRRGDTWNQLSLSLLILLIYNPYSILNIGLQLSYLGTLGIMLFYFKTEKLTGKTVGVTIAAQLMILPIMLYHFNIFSPYFLISNFLVAILIGPILIYSFINIGISFISLTISKILALPLNLGISLLIKISDISSWNFSKIYISTPKIWQIILYYLVLGFFSFAYFLYKTDKITVTKRRFRNIFSLIKYKIKMKKQILLWLIIFIILIIVIVKVVPKDLKIHFVDVGQGDSTFIVTPRNKTILIDGGGSLSEEFDTGKQTLLPYILDRGYTSIDYVFISHFDHDHVGGILTILEELKVGQVIIGKQGENSDNYQNFLDIVKEKKIKVKQVKKGDRIKVENSLYFDILWPQEELIQENILNNNSLVMKLKYFDFSILFTGDIEKIAEEEILDMYDKNLKTNILKVAHHGSKSSSIKEFIEKVNPKIALIGVGKNNLFGHPSDSTLQTLEDIGCVIFRTDLCGEVVLRINKKGKVRIKTVFENV